MEPASAPGRPFPLGVTVTEDGIDLAVFSAHAERIELCLFDPAGRHETARLALPERTDGIFHGAFPGIRPGQVYGLRAHGPWAPERGHRFNPAKLLLDPYAKGLLGNFRWAGPNLVDRHHPFLRDGRDSAPFVPKAVVVAPLPQAEPQLRPPVPWDRTVLYETHVKGLTKRHPAVPPEQQGTYLGLAHPAVLDHLVRLGVTTVELLPVTAFVDELHLVRRGLVNYWGYNPAAFMVPEARYAVTDPRTELVAMVAALHSAGIEVVLDIVFNHTAESDLFGPTLSFRGLDNASYYRLDPHDPRLYENHAGCGNTLNLGHPRVMQLVMDSLRYWAALGVDGFRFDLATTLGRDRQGEFKADAALLQAMAQDPVLGGLKLIAEPWDLGPYGYRQGQFPQPFSMWNDRFRDCARRFWRGDEAVVPELAGRLLGSADLFEGHGRKPQAGINLITSHDGFTLRDLVSYAHRHNEANGEHNRDGHHDNLSSNEGTEGPSADRQVEARRALRQRSLLATLLLAQGVPMLLGGDELGQSQSGNNNAYCQDGPLSWYAWGDAGGDGGAGSLLAFVRRLIELRQRLPALRRTDFLHGRERNAAGIGDVGWYRPDGGEMKAADWQDAGNRCVGLLLGHDAELVLLLVNAARTDMVFRLPKLPVEPRWQVALDSAAPDAQLAAAAGSVRVAAGALVLLEGRA
ncbi:MAG: glycogen debranching protein GlgX [Geminicoccaceae bacterium]